MTEYLFLGGPADGQCVKIEEPLPDIRRVYERPLSWETALRFDDSAGYEKYAPQQYEEYFYCVVQYRGHLFTVYTHQSPWEWDRIWGTLIDNYRKPEARPI